MSAMRLIDGGRVEQHVRRPAFVMVHCVNWGIVYLKRWRSVCGGMTGWL